MSTAEKTLLLQSSGHGPLSQSALFNSDGLYSVTFDDFTVMSDRLSLDHIFPIPTYIFKEDLKFL